VPYAKRTKLDAKAKKCIFIGYDQRKNGWKCMDPETYKFFVSRDVIFDEGAIIKSTGGDTSFHN
jgi:hypothetical protein